LLLNKTIALDIYRSTVTSKSKPSRFSKDFIIALIIFVAALSVRLIYLFQISDSPAFFTPTIDSGTYHEAAHRLITEGVMAETFFWQSFFYPFFLSRIYYFTGSSIIAAKLFGAALGSVTCVLVYFLGRQLFSRSTGIIAAFIVALYGPLIFFDTELLATGWAAFWSVALILLLLKAAKPQTKWPLYLLTGLCAGLAVITRASFVPFVAASGLWLIWKIRRGTPNRWAAPAKAALFVCATAIAPAIVGGISYIEQGRFAPLPEAGPVNLYLGNNPDAEQTIMLRPGRQWRQILDLPRTHGIEDEIDSPAFFMQQFLDYVRTKPGDYLKGLLRKTVQLTSSREMPRNFDVYLNLKFSSLLSVLVFKAGKFGFPFGLLLPFAAVGLALNIRRIPAQVFLFLILYPLAIILVFVCARYKAPVIPILALPAALGIQKTAELLRHQRFAALCLLISAVIAIAAVSSLAGPFGPEKFNYEAEMYFLVAYPYYENGDIEEADKLLAKAIGLKGDYADAYILRGAMYGQADQPNLAVRYLSKAVELAPDFYVGRYRLAENLIRLNKPELAAEQLRLALAASEQQDDYIMSARIKTLLEQVSEPNAPQR
jgi:4-amino-4-deoxy-L-arabinose transferase-like glycosyltransferase